MGTGEDIGTETNMWEIEAASEADSTLVLDKTEITAKAEEDIKTETLTAVLKNTTGDLTWISSNTDVAEVQANGNTATLTLKAEGTSIITVSCGDLSAKCRVMIGCQHYHVDGVCYICGKECEHNWQNADGICTNCEYECPHKYTNNICTICGHQNTSCIAEGTLITLANGKQVAVEDLTGEEKLLVWDMHTGSYRQADIAYIINHNNVKERTQIIHLYFSDGTDIEIISDHGFYDLDLNKTVYINATNYEQFIGDWFVTQKLGAEKEWNKAQLKEVKIEYRETRVYEVVTYEHLTCFTNGLLSISSLLNPFCNIFEVDPNTLSYDKELMAKDIEKYGLFTYDDFKELIPEYAFKLYHVDYLKVALGKGLTTWDEINFLVDFYHKEISPLVRNEES